MKGVFRKKKQKKGLRHRLQVRAAAGSGSDGSRPPGPAIRWAAFGAEPRRGPPARRKRDAARRRVLEGSNLDWLRSSLHDGVELCRGGRNRHSFADRLRLGLRTQSERRPRWARYQLLLDRAAEIERVRRSRLVVEAGGGDPREQGTRYDSAPCQATARRFLRDPLHAATHHSRATIRH